MLVSDKVFCDSFVCFISPAAWLFGGLFHTFFDWMDNLVNDKIEGNATLIHVEPEIDYAFRDWMDKLVNENMEINTSWTHVERENDSGHMKRARKE